MTHATTINSAERATTDGAADLRVVNTRTLRGPNLWRLGPVIVAELRAGRLAETPPGDLSDFTTALRRAVPGLWSNDPGPSSPLASWGGLLLRTTLELQRLAGSPAEAEFGRVVHDAPQEDRWTLAIGFDEEELGHEALRDAARILRDCLRGGDPEIDDTIAELTRRYHRARPGPTTLVMIEAARRRGIPVRRNPDDGVVQLGLGATLRRLQATMTDFTSVIATTITSDKHLTKLALERVGLATPGGDVARTLEGALEIAEEIGFPVLLKPLDANNGRGISGRIDDADGVRAAWPLAVAEHPSVVIERFAQGNDHRVVVVAGRVVAVVERVPAHVVGDGRHSIRQLATEINRDPNRSKVNPSASLAPLPLDERTEAFLARGDRTLDTVPSDGEIVYLRATANISTGGTAIDRTDEIHPANRALCELAAGAVGLDVAGLDVLTPDISVPFRENGAVVIEVNASPGIRMHTHPDNGTPRDVPGAILDMLYPPGAPVTIPVIAVTGTNGKTTTTRLIAHLFRNAGRRVGYTTTDGVYFQEQLLLEGDLTGPFAANIILSHPAVDVAVLETARGGILRSGLGFEECDVGVVTNVTADHLGLKGIETVEQLADVKAVIPAVVKPSGYAVLNADDPLVYGMRERTRGGVALFSMAPAGASAVVEDHLRRGGIVARIELEDGQESFVVRDGEERHVLATVSDVPLTFGGLARFSVANVLAAACAAYVQGLTRSQIREGLLGFVPSAGSTPGRLNVIETTRGRVLIDYAHNAAAIEALLAFVQATPASRRMALLSAPGDRRDEDLREIGRLAAGLDLVIVKEHEVYRRGREPGEINRVMTEGLVAAGQPPEATASFTEEHDAVEHVLSVMRPGDVVVIIADDTDAVMEQLQPYVVPEIRKSQ
jgi:cyanophycin synthetase